MKLMVFFVGFGASLANCCSSLIDNFKQVNSSYLNHELTQQNKRFPFLKIQFFPVGNHSLELTKPVLLETGE